MDRAEIASKQWARERPDLPLLPIEIVGRVLDAAARVIRDHMNPLLAEADLQVGEFDVLTPLRRSGEPYMLSPTQLYESAGYTRWGTHPAYARVAGRIIPGHYYFKRLIVEDAAAGGADAGPELDSA